MLTGLQLSRARSTQWRSRLGRRHAHVKEHQEAWLVGSNQLPDRCPRYPLTSPALAPKIGAAQDVNERMLIGKDGMEPHFISRNAAALHTFLFHFPDFWSRKEIKSVPSRKPEVSADHWNDVYLPADDQSRLRWLKRETVMMLEAQKESRGGIYLTIDEVVPHSEEYVEIVIKDEVFYEVGQLMIPS